jgi:predicted glycosyl hydrolase (DUF1957 family)
MILDKNSLEIDDLVDLEGLLVKSYPNIKNNVVSAFNRVWDDLINYSGDGWYGDLQDDPEEDILTVRSTSLLDTLSGTYNENKYDGEWKAIYVANHHIVKAMM